MKPFGIDVNFVDDGSGKGKSLQANPKQAEIKLPGSNGNVEHGLVTWTFKGLPAGLTPVIKFDSLEVIASGPTATPGAVPRITFEVKLPANAKPGDKVSASYKISASGLAKTSPSPDAEGDGLVVVSSSDPPGGSKVVPASSHATA
jgi:hypothetical protein